VSDAVDRPTERRAEDFVDRIGRALRRGAERVRAEAEDIVADAQDVRRGQAPPTSAGDSAR